MRIAVRGDCKDFAGSTFPFVASAALTLGRFPRRIHDLPVKAVFLGSPRPGRLARQPSGNPGGVVTDFKIALL